MQQQCAVSFRRSTIESQVPSRNGSGRTMYATTPAGSFRRPGPEGWAELAGLLLRALPDLHLKVQEVLATDEHAVAYLSATGTHRGELLGMQPTGSPVRFDSVDLYRFEEGRIAESWPMPDLAGIRRALAG